MIMSPSYNPVSKKIQGKFPLGYVRGVNFSNIHYISRSPKKLTSYSRLTSFFLTIVKLGYYVDNCGFQLIICKLLYGIVVNVHRNFNFILY